MNIINEIISLLIESFKINLKKDTLNETEPDKTKNEKDDNTTVN